MREKPFCVEENKRIADNTYMLSLSGDASDCTRPGSFVNVRLDGFFLRRPISVCDASADRLTLIYKAVGDGTRAMTELKAGCVLDLLTGLGNGYDTSKSGEKPLLVGGGVGVPPLYMLCKRLVSEGKKPTAVLGFGKVGECFFTDEFKRAGAEVIITTADGTSGIKGFVTDALKELEYTYFYACGPEAMLRAVYGASGEISGQFSLEERMGCGFGACMGCSIMTKSGPARVCREGPVFEKEALIW